MAQLQNGRAVLVAGGLDPYSTTMGRSYVPVVDRDAGAERNPAFHHLSKRDAETMSALVDRLLPGDGYWPAAGRTDAVRHIDQVLLRVPELRAGVRALMLAIALHVEAAGRKLMVELAPDDQDKLLRSVEQESEHSGAFRALYEFTCEAYYRHPLIVPLVTERTGFDTRRPLADTALPPFDESRLERVRALPERYRSA